MKRKEIAAALALWLGASSTVVQAQQASCMTTAEAESMVLTLLPDALDAVAGQCAASLPVGAALRQGLPPLLARYRAEVEPAKPAALAAVAKIDDKSFKGVDPKAILPLFNAIAVAKIKEGIKPAICPQIDRGIRLIAPLPPRNVAGLIIMMMESGTAKGKSPPFRICPATP